MRQRATHDPPWSSFLTKSECSSNRIYGSLSQTVVRDEREKSALEEKTRQREELEKQKREQAVQRKYAEQKERRKQRREAHKRKLKELEAANPGRFGFCACVYLSRSVSHIRVPT